MRTNITKKELADKMRELLENIQEVGFLIGSDELNYMTDEFRDEYASAEGIIEGLIEKIGDLKPRKKTEKKAHDDAY